MDTTDIYVPIMIKVVVELKLTVKQLTNLTVIKFFAKNVAFIILLFLHLFVEM